MCAEIAASLRQGMGNEEDLEGDSPLWHFRCPDSIGGKSTVAKNF